jgi:phage-related protein
MGAADVQAASQRRHIPDKPLIVLHGTIKTPPMSHAVRLAAGYALRRLQQGEVLGMPESRPMPGIGPSCHELRLADAGTGIDWRIVYVVDDSAIVVLEVFKKNSQTTPESVKSACRERLRRFLAAKRGE